MGKFRNHAIFKIWLWANMHSSKFESAQTGYNLEVLLILVSIQKIVQIKSGDQIFISQNFKWKQNQIIVDEQNHIWYSIKIWADSIRRGLSNFSLTNPNFSCISSLYILKSVVVQLGYQWITSLDPLFHFQKFKCKISKIQGGDLKSHFGFSNDVLV